MGKDQSTQYSISIHTTASVVTPCILMFPVLPEISIHTTASVVTGWRTRPVTVFRFQSTTLHQWWLNARISVLLHLLFQSTPLHQWWPRGIWSVVFTLTISIHTTASVVTEPHDWKEQDHEISIHTTASVVTDTFFMMKEDTLYFNPHHCISGDTDASSDSFTASPISIHTTASVVTVKKESLPKKVNKFQSTPLHQWWPGFGPARPWHLAYFNPHHCISGDLLKPYYDFLVNISIHTTASVVTKEGRPYSRGNKFQSTPLHQWWRGTERFSAGTRRFQSTPLHQWWQESSSS